MSVLLNTLVSSAMQLVSGLIAQVMRNDRFDLQLQPVRVRADEPTKLQRQLRR